MIAHLAMADILCGLFYKLAGKMLALSKRLNGLDYHDVATIAPIVANTAALLYSPKVKASLFIAYVETEKGVGIASGRSANLTPEGFRKALKVTLKELDSNGGEFMSIDEVNERNKK